MQSITQNYYIIFYYPNKISKKKLVCQKKALKITHYLNKIDFVYIICIK